MQRQLGAAWMVSANYLNSRGHRLPIGDQLNPAVFSPGATTATTNQRRVTLGARKPRAGRSSTGRSPASSRSARQIQRPAALGTAPIRERSVPVSATGRSRGASRTSSTTSRRWRGSSSPSLATRRSDRGSCGVTDQTHVVNLSTGLPGARRASAGVVRDAHERLAGLDDRQRAGAGRTSPATTGVDNALNGQANQRPEQGVGRCLREAGIAGG